MLDIFREVSVFLSVVLCIMMHILSCEYGRTIQNLVKKIHLLELLSISNKKLSHYTNDYGN